MQLKNNSDKKCKFHNFQDVSTIEAPNTMCHNSTQLFSHLGAYPLPKSPAVLVLVVTVFCHAVPTLLGQADMKFFFVETLCICGQQAKWF